MKRAVLVALCVLLLVPLVAADPEVRDVATYSGAVVGAGDYFEFASGSATTLPVVWTVTAPNGEEISFTKVSNINGPRRLGLDGSCISPCGNPGVEGPSGWAPNGDLSGAPVEGTWTLRVVAAPTYTSFDAGSAGLGTGPGPTLSVAGKAIHFGVNAAATTTTIQLWNWHQTTGSWNEPSTVPTVTGGQDTPNEGPEEDPNEARYYTSTAPPSCADQAGSLGTYPSGPPSETDNDMDGVPGEYSTPQEEYFLQPDCTITTQSTSPLITPGPDPDDNDAGNPGASCTPESFLVPTGNVTPTDADMDGLPGSYEVEYEQYDVDEDCNVTPSGQTSTETVPGPDPDDNDPNDPPEVTDDNPKPFTGGSSVSCSDEVTINGVWARGATQGDDTYGRFAWQEGTALFDDLRDNPFVQYTAWTNLGAGFNGTHSEIVAYNNAAGNSYQFLAREGTTGLEQAGLTFTAEPGQCVILEPNLAGLERDLDEFDLEVSQAQCSGDPVQFGINAEDYTTAMTIEVAIYDDTGAAILSFDDTTMHIVPGNKAMHANHAFPYGSYLAVATFDRAGLLTPDLYDSAPFNVPFGTCTSAQADLGPLEAKIDALDLTLNDHRDNTLEIFGMDFNGIEASDWFWFLFWILALLLALYKGWLITALASTINVFSPFYDNFPIKGPGGVFLFIFALWLETLAYDKIYSRNKEIP